MKLRLITYLSGLFLLLTAFTPVKWQLKDSAITFKIKNAGLTVNGSFGGLQTDIQFDEANPDQSSIFASLETETIDTNIGLRNKHLKKELYFDVDKYPKITMRSTKIKKTGNNTYDGYFDLTIKDKTKSVKVPFTFVKNGKNGELKGQFDINRLDYNVGESSWVMSNDVTVFLHVNVIQ